MSDTVKFKNVSGEALSVAWLDNRLALPDTVIEVPAEDAWAYGQQTETWAPYDTGAKKATKAAADEIEAARAEEAEVLAQRFPEPDPETGDEPAADPSTTDPNTTEKES